MKNSTMTNKCVSLVLRTIKPITSPTRKKNRKLPTKSIKPNKKLVKEFLGTQLLHITHKTFGIIPLPTAHLSTNLRTSPPLPLRLVPETAHEIQPLPFNANALVIIQRPWRRVKKHDKRGTVLAMVRRNCRVYENIGFSRRSTRRFSIILDPVSGRSFTKKEVLPESICNKIKHTMDKGRIIDANNRSVNVDGTINIRVYIRERGDRPFQRCGTLCKTSNHWTNMLSSISLDNISLN